MPSLSRMRKWLVPVALVILIIASTSVPVLQWLLPDNPLVADLATMVAVISALIAGYELLWDHWLSGRRKSVIRSAAPTNKYDYLNDLIQRLSTEQEQYVPLGVNRLPMKVMALITRRMGEPKSCKSTRISVRRWRTKTTGSL